MIELLQLRLLRSSNFTHRLFSAKRSNFFFKASSHSVGAYVMEK